MFFRADSLGDAMAYLWRCVSTLHQDGHVFTSYLSHEAFEAVVMIVLLLVVEWVQRHRQHGLDVKLIRRGWVRFSIYYLIVLLIYLYGADQQDFIYFQF